MPQKFQKTKFHLNFGKALDRLEKWSFNPWRRYSLLFIILLTGFWIGSSIGMLNGVLALMDPIGAFFTVLIIEIMIRVRRYFPDNSSNKIAIQIIDFLRFGLLYGLFIEGFKLL